MHRTINSVVIVGAGLIGTSIALGLKSKGLEVELLDQDMRAQGLANDLVANGEVLNPDLVVLAVPISATKSAFESAIKRYPKAAFIDTGSVKFKVLLDIQSFGELADSFCPTHPMAGREIDGAEAAQGDLFEGRSWVITPVASTKIDVIAKAKELIELLGGKCIEMDPKEHDKAVARISHLPQIVSSLLASQFVAGSDRELSLAGGGAIDTTRIAASNSSLWSEILAGNGEFIKPLLIDLQNDLSTLIDDLAKNSKSILEKGAKGRSKLPGKHGGMKRDYIYLPVVIEDKPGELAKLFDECAIAGVGVEDLTIEHSPGAERGLITLALMKDDAKRLESHLREREWRVHPPRLEK